MKDQEKLQAGLYMVSTPIGNLEDLSFRALRVLRDVDWIAAEDTRESRKLLESQGINTKLISLHEHSGPQKIAELAERLANGETGAYVSDAGSPGICDPGAELVRSACAAGVKVVPIPGASAPVALLSVSGFSASEFHFRGFFPREKKEREAWARAALAVGGLQVFFESPHRIKSCLEFLAQSFPDQEIVVGRELTKKFETISRGNLAKVSSTLSQEDPRGEYVLILELAPAPKAETGMPVSDLTNLMADLVNLGANQKTLVRVAMSHGSTKNKAYDLALEALGKH